MQAPTSSPWGNIVSCDEVAPGIYDITTPSHGGIYVSPELTDKIPPEIKPFAGDRSWWEENTDWAVPALVFEDEFRAYFGDGADEILDEAREKVSFFFGEPDGREKLA